MQVNGLLGLSRLLESLGPTGRRAVLGHSLNTQTLTKTDEQKTKGLSKFAILCWASFIAILGHMWFEGHRLDTTSDSVECVCSSSTQQNCNMTFTIYLQYHFYEKPFLSVPPEQTNHAFLPWDSIVPPKLPMNFPFKL